MLRGGYAEPAKLHGTLVPWGQLDDGEIHGIAARGKHGVAVVAAEGA